MGNITGRDGLPVDASRRSSRSSSRRAPGSSAEDSLRRLRVGRHRLPVVGGHLHPDGPARRACAARACSSAASSTSSTSALVIGGRHAACSAEPRRPTDILRPTAAQEPSRMLTEKSDAAPAPATHHAPKPGVARRPDLLLRGRLGPDARRQGQHHDPRVHVRDGDLRGHPRLLERRPGRALRAEAARARRAHPPVVPDPADGGRPVGRRADPADRRDGPPQRLPRGRLHPAVVLQVDRGDRRPAARPRERAVHHRAAVRRTTSTPNPASGS